MKNFFKFLATVFLASILFTSCTMQKRVYMPGYNVEWLNGKHVKSNKKSEIETSVSAEQSNTNNDSSTTVALQPEIDKTITASLDDIPIVLEKEKSAIANKKTQVSAPIKNVNEKKSKTNKKNSTSQNEKEANGFAIGGFVCSIVGLALGFFALGIPFLVFGVLGIVLSAAGLNKSKELNDSGKILATVGLIIGIINILLFAFLMFSILFDLGFIGMI